MQLRKAIVVLVALLLVLAAIPVSAGWWAYCDSKPAYPQTVRNCNGISSGCDGTCSVSNVPAEKLCEGSRTPTRCTQSYVSGSYTHTKYGCMGQGMPQICVCNTDNVVTPTKTGSMQLGDC